jgi:hypothetical protein
LQIRGKIGKSGLGFVTAYLISQPKISATIRFYVDTGASSTTISDRDAKRIGIDYKRLKKAPWSVTGVGGQVDAYLLKGCLIMFQHDQSILAERLDYVTVLRHNPRNKLEEKIALEVPSLMGLDILRKYRVHFVPDGVILTR